MGRRSSASRGLPELREGRSMRRRSPASAAYLLGSCCRPEVRECPRENSRSVVDVGMAACGGRPGAAGQEKRAPERGPEGLAELRILGIVVHLRLFFGIQV